MKLLGNVSSYSHNPYQTFSNLEYDDLVREEIKSYISNDGWHAPQVGILKFNVDESVRQDSLLVSCEGLFRDYNDSFNFIFFGLGICTPLDVEVWILYHGFSIVVDKGFLHISAFVDTIKGVYLASRSPFISTIKVLHRIGATLISNWNILYSRFSHHLIIFIVILNKKKKSTVSNSVTLKFRVTKF
ncbi:hypothetical protein RIF29_24074 [Crotalaria pallida]|uniref:Uncharacterized protein n=1 Tax=Crotalaria pallida TaxID=3830 RepID=A0AAN9EP82_CROPI